MTASIRLFPKESGARAVVLALGGFVMWALGDGISKIAGQTHVPIIQIIGISSFFAAFVAFANVVRLGTYHKLLPHHWRFHFVRFGFVLISAFSGLVAFTKLPLTQVYVILFLSPLLLALCAALFMRETLNWRQIVMIGCGFVGVLLSVPHSEAVWQNGSLVGYVATGLFLLCFVVLSLLMRLMGRTETMESITFLPFFGRALCLLPFCLMRYQPMTLSEWIYIALFGVFTGLGTMFVASAYKHAPVAVIAPLHYFQIVVGALMGYSIWGDIPSPSLVVGAAIIIGSGLLLVRVNATKKLEKIVDEIPV